MALGMRGSGRLLRALRQCDGPVVVAVISVGVMQATVDQVINVVAVGNSLVTATRTMNMRPLMG